MTWAAVEMRRWRFEVGERLLGQGLRLLVWIPSRDGGFIGKV